MMYLWTVGDSRGTVRVRTRNGTHPTSEVVLSAYEDVLRRKRESH